MSEIGKFLKAKRKEAGFTQQKLAKACGLQHDSTVNRIEQGERKVSWAELGEISRVLGNFHVFEALLAADYITEEDINPLHKLYRLNELTGTETAEVQKFIEFLLFKRLEIN